jgi:hypothetical protein
MSTTHPPSSVTVMEHRATRTLTITPGGQRRTFLLNDGREPVGSLAIARSLTTHGEIRTPQGRWPVMRDAKEWSSVDTGDPGQSLVSLRRDDAAVPGISTRVPWHITGRFIHLHGQLGQGDHAISLHAAGWRGPHATAEITGAWENEHLVVLTCFFGLYCRRRRAITLLST